jgi:GntR family transcriptional regulator, colanic acid and biofilm gene transcriptional regulator
MQAPSAPSLEEQAYRKLRQALVEGVFSPGQKLSIRRLAEALGTSPMPARTALRRLAAEQAIDVLPSGTAVVPRLTRAAFKELSAVRAELEPLAVRLAAPRFGPVVRASLREILEAERAARAAGNPEDLLRSDRSFLFTIYASAAAPMLFGMIEATWLRRGPHFWDARWLIVSRPPGAVHHAEILAALERSDSTGASDLLRKEIEGATAYLLERMHFADDPAEADQLGGLTPIERPRRRSR